MVLGCFLIAGCFILVICVFLVYTWVARLCFLGSVVFVFLGCRMWLGLDQAGGLACWIFGFGFGFAYLVGLVGYVTTRFGVVVLCFGYCCFVGVCL